MTELTWINGLCDWARRRCYAGARSPRDWRSDVLYPLIRLVTLPRHFGPPLCLGSPDARNKFFPFWKNSGKGGSRLLTPGQRRCLDSGRSCEGNVDSGNNSTPSVDANPGGSSLSALSSTFLYAQGTAGGGHDGAETPGPHRPGVSSFAQAGPLTAFRAVWCIPHRRSRTGAGELPAAA